MRSPNLSFVPLLAFLLGACSTVGPVETTTTIFYTAGAESRGSIAVRPAEERLEQSLEFRAYKAKIESHLKAVGYSIAAPADHARYVALVSYGIDNGKTSEVSVPIYGQTGGGTTYTSGTVYGAGGPKYVSGSSYSMPTYGVIGSTSQSATVYARAIAIDIVEIGESRQGAPEKRYEIRAKSTGTCSALTEVFDEMLDAMFTDFPGESGRAHKVNVAFDGHC